MIFIFYEKLNNSYLEILWVDFMNKRNILNILNKIYKKLIFIIFKI